MGRLMAKWSPFKGWRRPAIFAWFGVMGIGIYWAGVNFLNWPDVWGLGILSFILMLVVLFYPRTPQIKEKYLVSL